MENNNVSRRSSQVMELKQLIAGPLIATIEADALSAQKYLSYVLAVAFESYNPTTGETGKLRMLTFSYYEQDGVTMRKKSVSLSLLTLIPLPLLQIHEADFDFDIKILDALYEKSDEKFSTEEGHVVSNGSNIRGFRMRASLAPQKSAGENSGTLQQSLTANMKVKVKMRQADMPAGLSNILHLTANNMQIEDTSEEEGGEK